MPAENVELVRRGYDALARGDLEAFFEDLDPANELHASAAYFDAPHTYRDHAGMRELLRAQAEVFDESRAAPERFFDAGDQILAIVRAGGWARQSERR